MVHSGLIFVWVVPCCLIRCCLIDFVNESLIVYLLIRPWFVRRWWLMIRWRLRVCMSILVDLFAEPLAVGSLLVGDLFVNVVVG